MVSFLHTIPELRDAASAASLSSARFIPDIVCISSIHLFVGWPLFLLPSPHNNNFSLLYGPSRMTASYTFPCHLLASHGRTTFYVSLPSVSAINLFTFTCSKKVYLHLQHCI